MRTFRPIEGNRLLPCDSRSCRRFSIARTRPSNCRICALMATKSSSSSAWATFRAPTVKPDPMQNTRTPRLKPCREKQTDSFIGYRLSRQQERILDTHQIFVKVFFILTNGTLTRCPDIWTNRKDRGSGLVQTDPRSIRQTQALLKTNRSISEQGSTLYREMGGMMRQEQDALNRKR